MTVTRFTAGIAASAMLAMSGFAIAQDSGNVPTIQQAAATLWDVKLDGGTYCVVAGKPINVQAPVDGMEVLPAKADASTTPELVQTSQWTVPAEASMFDIYNLRAAGAQEPGAKLIVVPQPDEEDLLSIVNVLTAANCKTTLDRFAAAKEGKPTVDVYPGG